MRILTGNIIFSIIILKALCFIFRQPSEWYKFERGRHTAVFWRMIRSSGGGIWQNNADGGGEGEGELWVSAVGIL